MTVRFSVPHWPSLTAAFVAALALTSSAATPVATYQLQGSFSAEESGPPPLTPVDPQGASKFVSDSALGQTRAVWAFNGANSPVDQQAGLMVSTTGLISPHTYSVDFVAKLNEREGGYRRLIDVQNRQSDNGFYVDRANNLDVYPASGTTAAWTNGVYHHVVVTTDGTVVNAYLDGVSQFVSTTNLLNLDVDPTDNPAQLMGFFLDNVANGGQGEWSSGSVALIRLWDGVLTPTEAQALASNPFLPTALGVTITSPPSGVTLVTGDAVSIAADITDAEGDLSAVQFYLDGALLGDLAPSTAGYVYPFTVPPAGLHTITVVAVKNDGTQVEQGGKFNSVEATAAEPAPSVDILTAADGLALAAGSTFTLSAAAFSNSAKDLERVDFYADGVVFASFDGSGAQLGVSSRPVRRDALSNDSVFKAAFQMPGVNKLVNLIAVALSKNSEFAHVSKPVTVQSVANTADHPPTVRITGLANGARVPRSAASRDVQVDIADPDAAATPAAHTRPIRRAFDASPLIARVQYFLNAILVKDSKEAPFTLPFVPAGNGTYVLTAIATDGAGLSAISDPVQVEAVTPSTLTIAVKGSSLLTEGGAKGKALITRSGDISADLTVNYKLKGSAVNGVDYQQLPTSVTIPAGASSVKVKIKPEDDGTVRGPRSVKVQLLAAPAGEYSLGTGLKAKFTLSDRDE